MEHEGHGLTLDTLVLEANLAAMAKGFHDQDTQVGTEIALIHGELSEALAAHRSGHVFVEHYRESDEAHHLLEDYANGGSLMCDRDYEAAVKDSLEDELADVVIRVADLCGELGISLETHVKAKLRFNKSRPRLHGKRY
jgi:NTP pyrophosphatase (non-canonical NTP hydrolase)